VLPNAKSATVHHQKNYSLSNSQNFSEHGFPDSGNKQLLLSSS